MGKTAIGNVCGSRVWIPAVEASLSIGRMPLGLMPVTGIPLPFVSYGGSSFLTLMLGIGLVESVAMRHKKLEFD